MSKVIAVIHHRDEETSLRNADTAAWAGCAGVCFIDMGGHPTSVDSPARRTKSRYGDALLVGTNRFTVDPPVAIRMDAELGLDFTWCDNPGTSSSGNKPYPFGGTYADRINAELEKHPTHKFFGSVAFKTQEIDPDPGLAALQAAWNDWIPTTSGIATGIAPEIEKLKTMHDRLNGACDLAVASGVTPENVGEISRYVEWIFVATGASSSFHELDSEKLRTIRFIAENYVLD